MLQYPNSLLEGPHPVNCLKLPACSLQSMVQDMSLSPCAEKSLPRGLLKSLETPKLDLGHVGGSNGVQLT